jgi:hypothetical protein
MAERALRFPESTNAAIATAATAPENRLENRPENEKVSGSDLAAANGPRQAFLFLRIGFALAPFLAGIDKFANVLTDWTQYLAPFLTDWTGLTASTFMQGVGVIEIIAGIGVAWKPKVFAYVVCAWLVGIIVNLLILGQYFDIALRDLGLAIGAFALGRLSRFYDTSSTGYQQRV